jgi:hypothetical protein
MTGLLGDHSSLRMEESDTIHLVLARFLSAFRLSRLTSIVLLRVRRTFVITYLGIEIS